MKRFISFVLAALMAAAMSGCAQSGETPVAQGQDELYLARAGVQSVYGVETPSSFEPLAQNERAHLINAQVPSASLKEEVRAVWISYLTMKPLVRDQSKSQFTANMDEVFSNVAGAGFNTVFVHARPFGDAFYTSEYFPWSRFFSGTEGTAPGYDPLEIMCSLADKHGLRIEAWLNPYRVRLDNKDPLAQDNQAKKWLAAGNDGAIAWNGGIFYNPGSAKARELILNGVKEIVKNYDVDGIHFDDYFYPTTDMSFDAKTYAASGSKLSQADWRRENVNILVRDVYAAIKEIDPDCVFGISPQGNMGNNYNGQFIDVAKWLSTPGYVDYICPQIYFGYQNKTCPYEQTVKAWNDLIKTDGIDLYIGLGAYKLGTVDNWAGEGKNEWVNTQNILAQMVRTARGASQYGGVAAYAYESLFGSNTAQVRTELANLSKLFS